MKVMVIVYANAETEAGVLPSEELETAMDNYNEELVKAGVMLDVNGLYPSAAGARVRFSGGTTTVIDGPFSEAKELIAGYWIWQVDSIQHAIDWVKRMPGFDPERPEEVEIRTVAEAPDFGEAFTPELQAQEERLREELSRNKA